MKSIVLFVFYSCSYIAPFSSHWPTDALLVLLAPRKATNSKKW